MALINHLLALPIRLSGWRFGGSGGLGGNTSSNAGVCCRFTKELVDLLNGFRTRSPLFGSRSISSDDFYYQHQQPGSSALPYLAAGSGLTFVCYAKHS